MRNALVPIITIIGLQVGGLLSGAVLTETVFSLPGIGTQMDILLAFPGLLLAIAIVNIPVYARLFRASVLSVKDLEYVTASRAVGASPMRIMEHDIVPNAITSILVQGTLGIATTILDAAGLSFLGLGAQPPTPEWDAMLSEERNSIFTAPHLVFIPGIAIMLTVLSFNLIGDALRDALDPRLRIE